MKIARLRKYASESNKNWMTAVWREKVIYIGEEKETRYIRWEREQTFCKRAYMASLSQLQRKLEGMDLGMTVKEEWVKGRNRRYDNDGWWLGSKNKKHKGGYRQRRIWTVVAECGVKGRRWLPTFFLEFKKLGQKEYKNHDKITLSHWCCSGIYARRI